MLRGHIQTGSHIDQLEIAFNLANKFKFEFAWEQMDNVSELSKLQNVNYIAM